MYYHKNYYQHIWKCDFFNFQPTLSCACFCSKCKRKSQNNMWKEIGRVSKTPLGDPWTRGRRPQNPAAPKFFELDMYPPRFGDKNIDPQKKLWKLWLNPYKWVFWANSRPILGHFMHMALIYITLSLERHTKLDRGEAGVLIDGLACGLTCVLSVWLCISDHLIGWYTRF